MNISTQQKTEFSHVKGLTLMQNKDHMHTGLTLVACLILDFVNSLFIGLGLRQG